MIIECPSCYSSKIKKNGKTYYGKQNYKCKRCGRQFIIDKTVLITNEIKSLIKLALKERLSLRALCRVFGVSLTWMQEFAQQEWLETPRNLGLNGQMITKVKRMQIFGIQADELWSFVGKKKNKRWIWVAYDPVNRLVVTYYIGKRNKKGAKKFWAKIPKVLKKCHFETDWLGCL